MLLPVRYTAVTIISAGRTVGLRLIIRAMRGELLLGAVRCRGRLVSCVAGIIPLGRVACCRRVSIAQISILLISVR